MLPSPLSISNHHRVHPGPALTQGESHHLLGVGLWLSTVAVPSAVPLQPPALFSSCVVELIALPSDAPHASGGTRHVTVTRSFHLRCDRNEMQGEIEEAFQTERAAADSLSSWGVSGAFLRIPVDFRRSSPALIWLFDYSSQGKPFNSTFWQTELFLAFHCSVLSAVSLRCLISEQAALKSWKPHPQVKREFQMILLALKFGRVSWARITKGIDLCSQ